MFIRLSKYCIANVSRISSVRTFSFRWNFCKSSLLWISFHTRDIWNVLLSFHSFYFLNGKKRKQYQVSIKRVIIQSGNATNLLLEIYVPQTISCQLRNLWPLVGVNCSRKKGKASTPEHRLRSFLAVWSYTKDLCLCYSVDVVTDFFFKGFSLWYWSLVVESINWWTPPIDDMVHHPFCKFFFLNNFTVSNVFVIKLFAESFKIRYSLGVYLMYMKILTFLNLFVLTFWTIICQIYYFFEFVDVSFRIHRLKAFKWGSIN